MLRRISPGIKLIVCLVVITGISVLIFINQKSVQLAADHTLFYKALRLNEKADSIRNSKPDTALDYYNKAIVLLQKSGEEKDNLHQLAISNIGIANVYSEKGNNKLALMYDSIAIDFANHYGDKQIKSKALIAKGTFLYRSSEYDKAKVCYQNAMDIGIEIHDLELQAKIFSSEAMIYFYQGENQKTIEGFRKALEIGKQINNEPLIAGNYMNLAIVYNNLSKNDSVLIYNKLALDLFRKMNDKNGEVLCYRNIGNIYYDFSDFGKAIEYYQLSVHLALEMDDKPNLAKAYHNLAEVYIHLGDNTTATDLLFKSIEIKEKLDDKLSLAKGYFGIGEMYYSRNEYPKAMTYFQKSLKISLELKYLSQVGSNYSSMASVYSDENKIDSAIFYYNKAMELYKQIDYTYGISNLCINLGDVYRVKKDYERSEKLLLQAMQTKTALEEEEGRAIVNYHLANLYLTKSNGLAENQENALLKKAEEKGLDSYKIAKRLGTLPVRRDVSKTLKMIYQHQGKFQEALQYAEISNSLSDSLLNKEKIQALTFAEARWNVEKKQQEINNLENTQKLNQKMIAQKETEATQHEIIIWIMIALFLLLSFSASVIALYVRKRRETQYQKQLTKMTALRMQNARNAMSPHFFFNVLSSLSGLSDHPEEFKEKFKNVSFLLRKVIENIDRTAVSLGEELAAVKAFVDLYSDKVPEPFTVEYHIEDGIQLKELIPAMMIQIPVENAIKHGLMPLEGEKKLTINITEVDGYQHITVSDNGIGLKASAGKSTGTGTGTGLKVLMQTIHLLNAGNQRKINFSVTEREPINNGATGTVVEIRIPYEYNYTI